MKHVWQMKPLKVKGDAYDSNLVIRLTKAKPYYKVAFGESRKYVVSLWVNKKGYISAVEIIERGEGKYK
ncbi:MAG: hypothetical protein ACXQS2_01800 [Methermicoccaceae archaeon]